MHNLLILIAQVYGQGVYNSSTYGQQAAGGSGTSGVLTNTGFDILVVVTLACTLALIAVLVRFWRRPSGQSESD